MDFVTICIMFFILVSFIFTFYVTFYTEVAIVRVVNSAPKKLKIMHPIFMNSAQILCTFSSRLFHFKIINQSIIKFISRHSTEARATVQLCQIKEKCLETDLKCVNGWSSSTVQWKRVPKWHCCTAVFATLL